MARILVVDDDDLVCETICAYLAEAWHETVTAAHGKAAIKLLESDQINLVVLDILMPVRDGIETIQEIRARWPALPILAISGGGREHWSDALHMAEILGASATLAKPFTGQVLVEHVKRLLSM